MLSLHLYWRSSIWSCIPNPKAWSNSVSTKRQHWAGRSRGRSIGCLHVKYGRWTNQGTLAWKGGGSPSSLPPPKFNSKSPGSHAGWKGRLCSLSSWVGLEGNFSGAFPVQLPGGVRCLQISTHGTHGPVDSGEWTVWNSHHFVASFCGHFFWFQKMFYIYPEAWGKFSPI